MKALEIQPNNLKFWTLLGLANRDLGKYDEAVKTLEKG